jgi:hypothetical protein
MEKIEGRKRTGASDARAVANRYAAVIDGTPALFQTDEGLFSSGKSVVNLW